MKSVVKKVYNLSQIHNSDSIRSKRLQREMMRDEKILDTVSTVIIGDSNLRGIRESEFHHSDVKVVSAGGLCIPAAVDALKTYSNHHSNVCKLIWSLGLNDILHGVNQHHSKDEAAYIDLLQKESLRIFPNADIYLIQPFAGISAVKASQLLELRRLVKTRTPEIGVLTPPSMVGKISKDKVHLTDTGRADFEQYIKYIINKY